MPRRAIGSLVAGLTITAVVLLAVGPMPVLAEEPGEEPSPPPSSDPSPTPSPSISPSLSPTPSIETSPSPSGVPAIVPNRGRTTTTSPSDQDPAGVQAPRGEVGGVIGNRPRQAGQTVSVAAVDDVFRPTSVTVTVGTTVVWTNRGRNPHTVTADDRAFDSGTLESGQTFSVTFDEVGTAPYYCQFHGTPGSGMTGVVIVQAAPQPEEGDGPASANELPATGADPIALVIVALVLAVVGLAALRAARRATD